MKFIQVVAWAVKVCGGAYAVTLVVQTPTFEWYMVRLVVNKDRFLKEPCYSGVRVCAF